MSGVDDCTGSTLLEGPVAGVGTLVEPEVDQRLGRLWRVICHDDPHTTMDFVVEVLMTVFRQPSPRAFELMLCVHHAGSALIGSWPESVARKKVATAQARARLDGFPLTFSVEADD
jgi:ATP-dependent Clp protease adaptor protein ClpS